MPYDASHALVRLGTGASPDPAVWDELWTNLYHQGDVGSAPYAAVPQFLAIYSKNGWADHNLPAYAAAVEVARLKGNNPDVPDWLTPDYHRALRETTHYCLEASRDSLDATFRRAIVRLVAAFLRDVDLYELVDFVEIGDEQKAIEYYSRYA